MSKMTGGQALAKSLHREGVRVIFGLPGVQLYHLLDGLYDEADIRFIPVRHEQATSYMADGYARASGGIGTALVVPGPGLQNASAGIGTAYSASSPILVVSGQIQRDFIGVDRGMLHEVNDQMDTIRPVTKWARRILKVEEVPEAVREAFLQLRSGRPRPVEIEIPPETLAESGDVKLLDPDRTDTRGRQRRLRPSGCRNAEGIPQNRDSGRRRGHLIAGRRGIAAPGGVPAGARANNQRGKGSTVGPSPSGSRRPAAAA